MYSDNVFSSFTVHLVNVNPIFIQLVALSFQRMKYLSLVGKCFTVFTS